MSKSKSSKITEIWEPFPLKDWKDRYEVSNMGNVRNIETGKLLKYSMKTGYKSYSFCIKNTKKSFKIHRIVAMAFVHNDDPENKKIVNHINGDKMDNSASNLEWCTISHNNQHAIDTGLNIPVKKAVIKYDPETELIEIYDSILEASTENNLHDADICKTLNGKTQLAGGFEWCYVDEDATKNNNDSVDLSKYKQIDGFPNYVINNEGKIYSIPYKRFLKYQIHKDGGGQMVQCSNLGKKKDFLVHRLVGMYFIPKENPKHNSIHHKDGDKSNNNIDNLEWCHVPGIEMLESKIDTPYYNPKTAIKKTKRKSVNAGKKDLLTANPRCLSKKQREERKRLINAKQYSGSKTAKTAKPMAKKSKSIIKEV